MPANIVPALREPVGALKWDASCDGRKHSYDAKVYEACLAHLWDRVRECSFLGGGDI